MKTIIVGLAVALSATPDAAANETCSPIGSWYGYFAPTANVPADTPKWLSTINGKSESSGTIVLELIGFDSTMGGFFPTAVGGTLIRGAWKRIDGNTFAVNALAVGVDAQGKDLYIAKMTGIDKIVENCNVVEVHTSLQLLDPITFAPLTPAMDQAVHYGHRITVD